MQRKALFADRNTPTRSSQEYEPPNRHSSGHFLASGKTQHLPKVPELGRPYRFAGVA